MLIGTELSVCCVASPCDLGACLSGVVVLTYHQKRCADQMRVLMDNSTHNVECQRVVPCVARQAHVIEEHVCLVWLC